MLLDLSIQTLAQKLRGKEISSADLIRESYAQIDRFDKKVNSVITLVDQEEVIEKAKNVRFTSPLSGIPFVMKDAYLTKGVRTTAASKILDDFIPPYSATVYRRLEEAGAILIGKLNMDAWGHCAST